MLQYLLRFQKFQSDSENFKDFFLTSDRNTNHQMVKLLERQKNYKEHNEIIQNVVKSQGKRWIF